MSSFLSRALNATSERSARMQAYLIVFVGAGIGGAARHGINVATARLFGIGFPYGTLVLNVIGSFVMGLMAGWFATRLDAGQAWRLFLTTGVLGGFTTFSAFSLDAVLLVQRGQAAASVLYVVGSVGLALAGLLAGLCTVRLLS